MSLGPVPDSVEEAEAEYLEYERAVRKTNANKFIWYLSDASFENKANVARAWSAFQEWNLTGDGTPYYERSKLWEIFASHTVFADQGLPKPVLAEMESGVFARLAPFVDTSDKKMHIHKNTPEAPTNGVDSAINDADHGFRQ